MSDWSPAQEARIQELMKEKSLTHVAAARLMVMQEKAKLAGLVKTPKAEKPAKVKVVKAKREKTKREPKYSKEAIIKAFDRGLRASEIAELETSGIKGVSQIYIGRILWGSANSGGISKDQQARRVEENKRRKARAEEALERRKLRDSRDKKAEAKK